jgi:hypothetical protein
MKDEIQLFETPVLFKLIPTYNETKANMIQMFFRMTNLNVFTACRDARANYMNYVTSERFREKFESQFLTNNTLNLKLYNEVSLLAMIQLSVSILDFVFDKGRLLVGGKHFKSRKRVLKYKKTRKITSPQYWFSKKQRGGVSNSRLASKSNDEIDRSIHKFMSSYPYNGLVSVVGSDYVSQFIFENVFTAAQQNELRKRPNEILCLGLIFQFVQHVVPLAVPFDILESKLTGEKDEIQIGGMKMRQIMQKLDTNALSFLSSITSLPVAQVSTVSAQALTPEQIVITNNALEFPQWQVLKETDAYFASGAAAGVSRAFQNTVAWSASPAQVSAAAGIQSMAASGDHVNAEPAGAGAGGQGASFSRAFQYTVPVSEGVCYRSHPLPRPGPNETFAILDAETIRAFNMYHALSATEQTLGEFGGVFVRGPDGAMRPNATVTSLGKRLSTVTPSKLTGHSYPTNVVIDYHIHPHDINDRLTSPVSGADLASLLVSTIYDGVPYGAAYAPEGLYVHSLNTQTIESLVEFMSESVRLDNKDTTWINKFNSLKEDIAIAGESLANLRCADISSRQIQYENVVTARLELPDGRVMEIPVGFDIEFYNQEALHNGTQIALGKTVLLRNITHFNGTKHGNFTNSMGAKTMPAVSGADGETFWNQVTESVCSHTPEGKTCVLNELPNPFVQSNGTATNSRVNRARKLSNLYKNPSKFMNFQQDAYGHRLLDPKGRLLSNNEMSTINPELVNVLLSPSNNALKNALQSKVKSLATPTLKRHFAAEERILLASAQDDATKSFLDNLTGRAGARPTIHPAPPKNPDGPPSKIPNIKSPQEDSGTSIMTKIGTGALGLVALFVIYKWVTMKKDEDKTNQKPNE